MIVREDKKLSGKRIGILGKGGSGKSTITVLLARALRNSGYGVCVLDADSTNVGLHQALGLKKIPLSLIEYFGGTAFSGGRVTCPVDDPTPLPGSEISLDKIPDEYYAKTREGIFLLMAGKIGDKGPGAGCDGPISKITRDLKISGIGEYPVTLVDLKAGLEDPARGVITSMDWIIVAVDANNASIQIAIDIKNIVGQIKQGVLPATRHLENEELVKMANKIFLNARIEDVLAVLSKIKGKEEEAYIKGKLIKGGVEPIGIIYEDTSVSTSWLKGESLKYDRGDKDLRGIVSKLQSLGG